MQVGGMGCVSIKLEIWRVDLRLDGSDSSAFRVTLKRIISLVTQLCFVWIYALDVIRLAELTQ